MRRTRFASALGTGLLALATFSVAGLAADQQALCSPLVHEEVLADQSILTFDIPADRSSGPLVQRLLLPGNTRIAELSLRRGQAKLEQFGSLQSIRGRKTLTFGIHDASPGLLEISVQHDGHWQSSSSSRSFDRILSDSVSGLPEEYRSEENGSYVIIAAPDFVEAAGPLLRWKRQKGLETVLVDTNSTGTSNEQILAWLQNAYDSWENPPEYLLLLGDVDRIPSWDFSGNVTDLPYSHLDGEDWLPDLLLGRISVESAYEAEAVIHKTVAYESQPYTDNTDWFTRSLMVAGNYGSHTPISTVTFCGEQLESIGFDPAETVFFPPMFNGVYFVDSALETGCSIVTYRGWAYGTAGWEPPHFTVDDIPGVETGAMNPVVMSFVCLNGDFSDDEPCFGEVFLRQGSPEEAKGAVAFIGNGEHWSHTRFNDAMAISVYEKIVEPASSDLGSLLLAGKLRFMDYFPHEMHEDGDEESVEFYFHIYNLLGDPELNYWRQAPVSMTVTCPSVLGEGSESLVIGVSQSGTPLEGVRIALSTSDRLISSGFSDESGLLVLETDSPEAGDELILTVTAPGFAPTILDLQTEVAEELLVLDDYAASSDPVSPGSLNSLSVKLENRGTQDSETGSLLLSCNSPFVEIDTGSVSVEAIPAGSSAWSLSDFAWTLDAGAADETRLLFEVSGSALSDYLELGVSAPVLEVADIQASDDGVASPGESLDLVLTLSNTGSGGTAGGTATLNLLSEGASLDQGSASFAALPSGGTASNSEEPFQLSLDETAAEGSGLSFRLDFLSAEGYELSSSFTLLVGEMDAGAPVGPDNYGYYIYDSADFDYPAERPVYSWKPLSPRYGGSGEAISFTFEGDTPLLDLPFDFPYYGELFSQIRVSDNGWISFDLSDAMEGSSPVNVDFYNWPIPNRHGNHSLIAPFWDNFTVDPDTSVTDHEFHDGVYALHDTESGAYVIEWSQMRHYRSEIEAFQTFQLQLLDPAVSSSESGDGEILFLYRQITDNDYLRNYSSVGMESPDESTGIQYCYANHYAPGSAPLGAGLALKLSTDDPVRDPLRLSDFSATATDDALFLQWNIEDTRPVNGWKVYRQTESGEEELLAELPSSVRELLDETPGEGYRIVALHPFGQESDLGLQGNFESPGFRISSCTPNPMVRESLISFSLDRSAEASVAIYDPSGRRVRLLEKGELPEGERSVIWDGRNDAGHPVASGLYFCRLASAGKTSSRKLVVVR
ncbi:MAG: C25 family cysteine peptidase [Candidatus Krumholzibacteria bacterium]|jgi:hypothetical protein|nr:C25 family cysteine peptidase [Candidatus Krumholzibacteria bacterium]MDP6669555.1 C25 family cysteine peptidase [Candidatus Krumholzibacteria bacterium]MDP6798023.1 C25 family cysteine peptidase [Candidatus Krumholzibacteria bacterium]MDP7022299.1 C25 family cysteine peptidase [Candidatus Krumholzibacteria bacterium]